MDFTKKDRLILQTLVAYFRENYGNVFLVAINDTQTIGVSGEMPYAKVADNLLDFIESLKNKNPDPEAGNTEDDEDLLSSVKDFIEDAQKDLAELDIKSLKKHLDVLQDTIKDIEAG